VYIPDQCSSSPVIPALQRSHISSKWTKHTTFTKCLHHYDSCTAFESLMRNSAMHVANMENNYYVTLLHKRAKQNNNVTFKCPKTNYRPNVAVHYLVLQFPVSGLAILVVAFRNFLRFLRTNAVLAAYISLGNHRFLPHLFELIFHRSS